MEFHKGRLIDHVHLRVSDLNASERFYRAALAALGLSDFREGPDFFAADELWIDRADGPVTRVHLAFQAPTREHVVAFHAATLAAGGRDNGGPGERNHYHPGYDAAYVLDLDGHNIEAVHHGPVQHSALSVVLRPAGD